MKNDEPKFLKIIRTNWSLILFAVTVIVWGATVFFNTDYDIERINSEINVHAEQLETLHQYTIEHEQEKQEFHQQILIKLTEMNTNLENQSEDIKEIKTDVKELQ